jgi:CRP-like cAMP-binding protein/N-acyl-L-homoserine lactone synthetase
MAIRVKVARSANELDDIYRLRHRVFVEERGKFCTTTTNNPRMMDHFDAMPGVANVIAYCEGGDPIGAIRVSEDSEVGLPSEQYLDFSTAREAVMDEYFNANNGRREVCPKFVCCSMLAVEEGWRNRRNVTFSLFKSAIGIMHSRHATHVMCTISAETLSMYGRMGFVAVGDAQWSEAVQDTLIPIVAPMDKVFDWAFSELQKNVDSFWLDNFSGQFERLLLSPGEVLFDEHDHAEDTYAVDSGWVAISREDPDGNEMVLANLSRGALFGELSVFDGEKRAARATALVSSEIICIGREHMFDTLKRNPDHLLQLLRHFAKRVRETDNLAMVQAFAPQTSRVVFALNQLWQSATPDRKYPGTRSVRIGPAQLARTARVREDEVRQVLELKKSEGSLDYGANVIRFVQEPKEVAPPKALADSPL